MSRTHILLIGCGNMGQALVANWQQPDNASHYHITTIDPHAAVADYASVSALPDTARFDIVVLAVKPQSMPEVLAECARHVLPKLNSGAIILSIAAGLNIASYRAILGNDLAFIRIMPNTPAAIGQGASVAYADQPLSPAQHALAEQLLTPTGLLLWAEKEEQFHAVTALSGSGPAYVFHLIEALCEAGERLGLPADMAAALARQTVTGSAALAAAKPGTAATDLRKAVTSPGGTTEAGLKVLMPALPDLMTQTLQAADARSRQLAGK